MIRDDVLSYLTSSNLGSYSLSTELPFSNSGTTLYVKNPKRIYVDEEQKLTEPLVTTFNMTINQSESTVDIYFSNDAKNLPVDYDTVRATIEDFKKIYAPDGLLNSTVETTSEYVNDLLVTRVQLKFVKLT